jgi:SAM-dependent methyltransferase
MYDYYLGGKDNFEADRVAAEQVLAVLPAQRRSAIENRRFLRRVVRYLAGEAGIDQFLDIGVGLPTQGAVHEVAHEINPDARVVYADFDPVVVSHANALLYQRDLSVVVEGDLRKPAGLLASPVVREHLDFRRPVAVLLLAVLHFVSDDDDPAAIVARLRDAVPPGSHLVISHVGLDLVDKAVAARAMEIYRRANEPIWPRSHEEIQGFFGDWELLEPGLVPKHLWRPVTGEAPASTDNTSWGAVARK